MKQVVQARLQRYWDIRAAMNFCFGGSGSGLILAAALGIAVGAPSILAIAAGLALIGAGLLGRRGVCSRPRRVRRDVP